MARRQDENSFVIEVNLLLLAAGRGRRIGDVLPKQYMPVQGKAIILHCLESLSKVSNITVVQPVIAEGDTFFSELVSDLSFPFELREPVVGGTERALSMAAGLAALDTDAEWVAVHDAARPLVSVTMLLRLFACAAKYGAAIPGMPVHDTIKIIDQEGRVIETPDRQSLSAIQTPQVARKQWFEEALCKLAGDFSHCTDDASILEQAGFPVHVSAGEVENRKITTPEDLVWLEQQLLQRGLK
ncbi:MAG: 2-C-methyl-D-erythritol 4-phosphate cytidylyltransferase [Mariprofundaceae bacterium]